MKKFLGFLMIAVIAMFAVGVNAATIYDLKKGGTAGFSSKLKSAMIQKVVVDASLVTTFYNGDTVELFNVPAKTLITKMVYQVDTPSIAAATIDIGIKGATLTQFIDNASIAGAAGTCIYGDGADGDTTVFVPYFTGETAKIVQISGILGLTQTNIRVFKGCFIIEMINMADE